jgi:hypothetical protein
MKPILLLAIATLPVLAAACAADNDAARLDHARILAVRSTPAHAAPGEEARIDVLAGDSAGAVFDAVPDAVTLPGFDVVRRADGWYVTAPAMLAGSVANVSLAIDGEDMRATKQLVFGDHADNPDVTAQVDGVATQVMDCSLGATRELTIATAIDQASVAWYSSLGTLDHDRSAHATFAADTAGVGIVLVVVRDPTGGVTWQQVAATVD